MRPRIFISAVTGEFGSTRQRVANILTRLGYEPVEEDVFGAEPGDIRPVLQGKMDNCAGLIQLVGHAYGSEPPPGAPASGPACSCPGPEPVPAGPEAGAPGDGFGRVSYTQFEFLYMRKLGRKTWLIFPGDACTHDTPLAQLDLPHDSAHPDPAGFQAERRAWQDAYRQRLRGSDHLYHDPASDAELELTIERLEPELRKLNRGFQRWQKLVLAGLLLIALLVGVGLWQSHRHATQQLAAQKVTKERLRAHLQTASEQKLAEDLAAADKVKGWEAREKERQAAQQAHASRLTRIDDLAASFAQLEGRADASVVLQELARIVREEGVDAALAYMGRQHPGLLERVRARQAATREQNRAELQPVLLAARLYWAKGDASAARSSYREIIALEPDWPAALDAFVWFLYDRSVLVRTHGKLSDALDLSAEALQQAEHYASLPSADTNTLRVLSAALGQRGDVLVLRAQPGDAEKAVGHYQRSLEIRERLLAANPDSAEAARDLSVSLERLGDFLAIRGQPGDAENALGHCKRSLEIRGRLLVANPDSAEAARDVSFGLDRLGDLLAIRSQPGDAEKALGHYQRSLEVRERLAANPDSAQAARDVSVSLNKLANFLVRRGQPGDAEKALGHYQRSLEVRERLRAASPDSAQAARDESVSLSNLADLLASRGQPGEAEKALGYYQRSLEVLERLLVANPDSARAARDVSVNLEKLADFLVRRGQPGDAEKALGHYQRSLEVRERLRAASPDSAEAARDVWVSCGKMARFAERTGKIDAMKWWRKAFAILDGMKREGRFLSAQDERVLELLRQKVQP